MLPDPPQLLLGLFCDQQTPVIGSPMVPPGQDAETACGAAVNVAEASTTPLSELSRTLAALVRCFMSMISVGEVPNV
jgi:hypothetical protein